MTTTTHGNQKAAGKNDGVLGSEVTMDQRITIAARRLAELTTIGKEDIDKIMRNVFSSLPGNWESQRGNIQEKVFERMRMISTPRSA
ncbi:MAG: hypothetical protein AAB726_03550 [Patescibacteria group bacterium]